MGAWKFVGAVVVATFVASSATAIAGEAGSPPSTWSGLYVGMNGGYGWSGMAIAFENFSLPGLGSGFTQDVNGSLVGGHLGLQQQIGSWVVGVETTFDGGNLTGSSSASSSNGQAFCGSPCSITDHERFTTEIDSLFTVTGRLGYTQDLWLAYVKGGFASADIREHGAVDAQFDSCANCGFSARAETDARHDGWIFGGGLEYMIDPHVILGMEYDFLNLEGQIDRGIAHVENGNGSQANEVVALGVDPDSIQTVTARLTILLNRPEPAVEPLK